MRTILALLFIVVSLVIFGIVIDHGPRLFTLKELHEIAKAASTITPIEKAFENVTQELMNRHPTWIHNDTGWVFINAGSWMGSFKLLHASMNEYILLFGTPLPTTGHSGRYWGEVHDFLMAGEFHQWDEGTLHYRQHLPGAHIQHPRWAATGMHLKANSWMLEYSSGVLPSYLPFAIADSLTSSLDYITTFKYFATYGKLVLRSILAGKIW